MKKIFPILSLLLLFSCNDLLFNEDQLTKSEATNPSIDPVETINHMDIVWDTLANGLILRRIDSLYIFQGDMVFKEKDLSFLCPLRSGGRSQSSYYWPGGKVYYSYDPSLSALDTLKCRAAMNILMANTSVTFEPKKTNSSNYVIFVSSSATQSNVGMIGGGQYIELDTSWVTYGNIMHEILHSLGFFHEHCRLDRDNYIVVYPQNIEYGYESQFQKYPSTIGLDFGSLDFDSIMMYSSWAFSKNGLATMRKTDGTTFYHQRDSLSSGDKEGIAAIYGPPYHRLESRYTIIEESVYGTTDKLITANTDSLVFYADKACTIRAALLYPREIRVKTTQKTANWNNWNYNYSYSYWTVTIPAGTSSYCLSQWIDTEWYEYSNPYNIDITTNEIVNYLVPRVYWGSN